MSCRMSGDEVNPATVAQPVEDVQGDGRWMSQVGGVILSIWIQCPRKQQSRHVRLVNISVNINISMLIYQYIRISFQPFHC